MTRKWWVVAAVVVIASVVAAVLVIVVSSSSGRSSRPATPGLPGAFSLRAVAGDSVAWLAWTPPDRCSNGPFQVQRSTGAGAGPWQDAGGPVAVTSYKDINRLDGMQLWYRVVATCGVTSEDSERVALVPQVQAYTWDFGRQVEGTLGTTEGWTVGAAATGGAAGTTVPPGSPGRAKGNKRHKRKETTTTAPSAVLTAATTRVHKRGRVSASGYLTVSQPPQDPTAVSPSGLNIPAAAYHELQIDVVAPAPSSAEVEWTAIGSSQWSAPVACQLTIHEGVDTRCQLDGLGGSWTGDIGSIKISFPGATTVTVDQIALSGPPAPKPLVGAIRWDGWFPTDSRFIDPSLYTDFDSRERTLGWFDSPGPAATSNGASLPQHYLDLLAEMQEAHQGGIDFWAFDWYTGLPELPASSGAAPNPFDSPLSDYESYVAGLRPDSQPLLDYALIIGGAIDQTDRKAGQLSTFPYWTNVLVPRLVEHFSQSAYVKVDGDRPLVYWQNLSSLGTSKGFGSCANGCWHLALAELTRQTEAAGLGAPYFVDTDSDASLALKYGFDGLSSYGPDVIGPVSYTNEGHQSWTSSSGSPTPESVDLAVAGQTVVNSQGQMLAVQPGLTPTLDHRPQNRGTQFAARNNTESADFWFDFPTYSQWEAHFRDTYEQMQLYPGRSSNPGVTLLYSWNEISEGGGIEPSTTYGSYLLDAIEAVRSGNYPAVYWDTWDDSNLAISYKGSWTEEGPSPDAGSDGDEPPGPSTAAPGAYNDDEHVDPNAVAGDEATLSVGRSTAVRLLATTGPDLGIEAVDLDGTVTDVDLYSPTTQTQVTVFERDGLAATSHQLVVSSTGQKDPSSSGLAIDIDAISALESRLGVDDAAPVAPSGLAASGFDGKVDLTWEPVPGASSYQIERASDATGPFRPVGTIGSSTQSPAYVDSQLPDPGIQLWFYQVRASIGLQLGPPSDVAPAVTTPDLSAGGTRSSGTAPTGDWTQVIFSGGRPQLVDGILFDATAPSATLVIEATKDGGRTWTVFYDDQSPGGAGGQRWLTFPPVTATGLKVIVGATQAPPAFGVYLR
jgi:hypothetical protein